jgi:hypothetical protein
MMLLPLAHNAVAASFFVSVFFCASSSTSADRVWRKLGKGT